MIIGCERCSTQFQLDDQRVPPGGARVRCSRCKHAFLVMPGGTPGEEEIHATAAQAAESHGVPDPSHDLAGGASRADAAPKGNGGEGEGEIESDWEFNSDFSDFGTDSEPEAGEAVAAPGVPEVSDEGFDPDSENDPGLFGEAGSGSDWSADDEEAGLALDTGDSLELEGEADSLEEPGDSEGVSVDTASDADSGLDLAAELASDLNEEFSARGSAPAPPETLPEEPDAKPFHREDLGSPGHWDVVGDAPSPAAAPRATPLVRGPEDDREWVERKPERVVVDDDLGEVSTRELWMKRTGAALGWSAALALCLAGLFAGFLPPSSRALEPWTVSPGVELDALATGSVENLHLGTLTVVRAELRNAGDAPRRGLELALDWRDASGAVLASPFAFAAEPKPELLRNGTESELNAYIERSSRVDLAAGETRRVAAIVWTRPPAAERFEIRVP